MIDVKFNFFFFFSSSPYRFDFIYNSICMCTSQIPYTVIHRPKIMSTLKSMETNVQ